MASEGGRIKGKISSFGGFQKRHNLASWRPSATKLPNGMKRIGLGTFVRANISRLARPLSFAASSDLGPIRSTTEYLCLQIVGQIVGTVSQTPIRFLLSHLLFCPPSMSSLTMELVSESEDPVSWAWHGSGWPGVAVTVDKKVTAKEYDTRQRHRKKPPVGASACIETLASVPPGQRLFFLLLFFFFPYSHRPFYLAVDIWTMEIS